MQLATRRTTNSFSAQSLFSSADPSRPFGFFAVGADKKLKRFRLDIHAHTGGAAAPAESKSAAAGESQATLQVPHAVVVTCSPVNDDKNDSYVSAVQCRPPLSLFD